MGTGSGESSIPGVILAGGRSRRMGGGDKTLRPFLGRPVLAHVIERLRPQVGALAINANGDPSRFAAWGLPVLPDPVADRPGPLAGILAALEWARAFACVVLTVPGDAPCLPPDLLARLRDVARGGAAYAVCAGRSHPLAALWPVTLAAPLRDALARGERRVGDWASAQGACAAVFEAGAVDPFLNLNTPEDVAAAERAVSGALD